MYELGARALDCFAVVAGGFVVVELAGGGAGLRDSKSEQPASKNAKSAAKDAAPNLKKSARGCAALMSGKEV